TPPSSLARCSVCGRELPRDEMFGVEPDLLCPTCAEGVRKRTAPHATGRLVNAIRSDRAPATVAVVAVCGLLFLAEYVAYGGNPARFPAWLWLLQPYGPTGNIGTGQAWRLLTSALLHGGWLHIIFNVWWILALGRAMEMGRGTPAFLSLFVGSALFSTAAQWYFGAAPGVGLSGVLYALAAYLWMRRGRDPLAQAIMTPYTTRLLGAWFVICILIPSMNIANWAHGGGIAWGLAAGWASTQRRPAPWHALLWAATLAAVLFVSTGHELH
ncbi:MAG: rhomboid family intramembrane serine protease, partial [Planctomycetota bacterium]